MMYMYGISCFKRINQLSLEVNNTHLNTMKYLVLLVKTKLYIAYRRRYAIN